MKRALRTAVAAAAVLAVAGCGSTQHHALGGGGHHRSRPEPPKKLSVAVEPWRLPYALAREAVVPTRSDQVIVAGGMLPDDTSSARAYKLDLSTGRSTPLPSLPVPVHDVAGGLYAGAPTLFGGGNSSEQSVVQRFANGSWHVVAHLPTTRSDLSVATVGSTTYVLGGYDGTGQPTEVLSQTGSSPLRVVGHLAVGVRYAATTVVGSSIYLFGGEVNGAELSVVQRFDTSKDRTRIIARLPVPVGHASAVALGTRILLMGGRVQPEVGTRATWWFNPADGRFTRGRDLPAPVTDAAVASSPDGLTAWLLGGESPSVRTGVIRLSLS